MFARCSLFYGRLQSDLLNSAVSGFDEEGDGVVHQRDEVGVEALQFAAEFLNLFPSHFVFGAGLAEIEQFADFYVKF